MAFSYRSIVFLLLFSQIKSIDYIITDDENAKAKGWCYSSVYFPAGALYCTTVGLARAEIESQKLRF